MSDLKISQLTPAASLTGDELIPLAISGTNESATTAQVASLATSSLTDNYVPYNNAGVLEDSYLVNDGNVLKSVYGGNETGLKLDFSTKNYKLGSDLNNGLSFLIDDTNGIINTSCLNVNIGGVGGLEFDYLNSLYKFGDFNVGIQGTSLFIDDTNQIIKTQNQGNDVGLKLDFATNNGTYALGDFANNGGFLYTAQSLTKLGNYDGSGNAGTSLYIDDGNEIIKTQNQGVDKGLKLDFANQIFSLGNEIQCQTNNTISNTGSFACYLPSISDVQGINIYFSDYTVGAIGSVQLGDFFGAGNQTRIIIDDVAQEINIGSGLGDLTAILSNYLDLVNLATTPTAGALSGYIIVSIGGVGKKIPYYNL